MWWTKALKGKKNRQISIGFVTDKGTIRERNEDSVWCIADGNEALCMVADGVGGRHGGEYASATAAKAVAKYWKKSQGLSGLKRIFDEAHAEIRGFMDNTREKAGTTLSVLYCLNDEYSVAHAGDSRVYRVSGGRRAKIEMLTKDDTWVAERIREGVITAAEAETHPKKHTLTNCLGGVENCKVYETRGQIGVDDTFLLCSDGLYNYIDEPELLSILRRHDDTQKTADKLLQLALTRGGRDNISAIVVNFH